MKRFSKLIGFIVVFVAVMAALCTMSFAADSQYTENVIPKMANYTAPSGIVTPYESNTSFSTWQAFDRNINTPVSQPWVAYEFPNPKVITKYTLIANYSLGLCPRDWTFEAWDGSQWIILDTRNNVTDWTLGVKKEFYFNNVNSYNKYKISVTSSIAPNSIPVINELEMMESIISVPSAPLNLYAIPGNSKVELKWRDVEGATSYNVKRSETPGGPYQTVTTITAGAVTYQDTGLSNSKTYYYVVSAVNAGGESQNSSEASATPQATNQLKLVLEVKEEKQLSVSDELSDNTEMDWISSDSEIATVDANGKVKGLRPGNTIITSTSKDKTYTESINVLVVDLEYQLAVDLNIGGTCRLTIDDLTNTTNVTWSSYDPTIATVSAKGKVTAVSEGLTYIIASDKDSKEIGRIYIRVRQ
jgi:hypothetical protein